MLQFVTPHYRVDRVEQLTLDWLRQRELDSLLLDADCTLKRYRQEAVSPEVAAWLEQLRAAGVGLCLVSNGTGRRIRRFADRLQLPCVCRAMKPLPRGVRAAVKLLGCKPDRAAIVGDQLFADIMAGRLAGVRSILVTPIHPEEEHWWTRIKRPPERAVLRWLERRGQ